MAVAAAVRQICPVRRHTARSTSFESAVNTGFHGTSRPVLHRSVRIKDGSGIDCCCGSGGMFVQSAKFIQAHSGKRGAIAVYGQEANADTWKMAKMNMAIRGIDADFGPYQADTFTNDLHPTLKADFILANPPFNYHPWNQEKLLEDVRWKYGIPPAGNANYAWIQHMIHSFMPVVWHYSIEWCHVNETVFI